jgi:small-conductance mechanosensitive channel
MQNGFSTVIVLFIVLIGVGIIQLVGKRVLRYVDDHFIDFDDIRYKQFVTLIEVVKWTLWVIIIISMLLAILSTVGIDITPLLTSAGIAGIGLSLASQSLLKDWIGGIFIIIENQYVIGDLVTIGDNTGTVEDITLRITSIRKFTGELCTISNGDVRIVTNMSRDWARAKVDLNVDMGEDIDRVLELVTAKVEEFAAEEAWSPRLLEPPKVLGPMTLDSGAFSITVLAKTPVGQHWAVGRELRKRLHAVMLQNGIDIPSSYITVKQVQSQ